MPSTVVDTSTDGEQIAAGVAGKQIRVVGLDLTADGQVVVTLKSNNSTVIWKTYAMNDASVLGGIVIPISNDRDMLCAVGESLNLGLGASIAVSGTINWAYV